MYEEPAELQSYLDRVRQGDREALAWAFDYFRPRLQRLIEMRMDSRLQGRVDSGDVLQETFLTVQRKLERYAESPNLPVYLWLRMECLQKLVDLHRFHLGARMRSAGQEISLQHGPSPQISSISLAAQLLGRLTSASQAAMRAELRIRVQEALNSMEPIDREILALRHFEELSNSEAAQVLNLSPTAACNRYVRALKRMKDVLTSLPGGIDALH